MQITPAFSIDDTDIEEKFVRGSGPGGQNVNKVATAVQLRFDTAAASLPDEVRDRLRKLAGARMTAGGVIVIEAREFRTQKENREAARERLAALVRKALVRPKPRRATRPTAAAKARRVEEKKRRSQTKRARGKVQDLE